MAMQGLLSGVRKLIGNLLGREPTLRLGEDSSKDWLPPVLGPADWSQGLMASMADSSGAWYFDRR